MADTLDELKRQVFHDMLNITGRVFIGVNCGRDVVIGRRGFLEHEKEKGLVLVFNRSMQFTWDDSGITATLVFGTTPEKCFIPKESIMTIFSPELNAQFSAMPKEKEVEEEPQKKTGTAEKKTSQGKKIIKVDFGRKNQ